MLCFHISFDLEQQIFVLAMELSTILATETCDDPSQDTCNEEEEAKTGATVQLQHI